MKDKKKILFIMHMPPPIHGASMVGQYIKDSKTINEVFITDYINISTSKSISSIGKGGFEKIIKIIKIISKIIVKSFRNKPDLYYYTIATRGAAFYKDVIIVLIIKIFSNNIVYHFHNKGIKSHVNNLYNNLLCRLIFANTRAILLSESLYEDIEDYFEEEAVFYCANGIKSNRKSDGILKDEDEINLLFLSNLIKSKGVFVVLEVCKMLKHLGVRYKCDIVGGEGDVLYSEVDSFINANNLQNNVKCLGKKYGEEKDLVFKNADIFLFPTFYPNECFPLVLLEAMSYSLTIITSYEGAIPDIISNDLGFLISPNEINTIVNTIAILSRDRKIMELKGNKGYNSYLENYTSEKFESRIQGILEKVTK